MPAGLVLEGFLHPPVQELPGLFMVEPGDHGIEKVDQGGAGPGDENVFPP